MDLWAIENEIGLFPVCGVDEAGRGPFAGPVCAAAVVLPKGLVIEGLNDSKKLTEKRREELFERITSVALDYGIALATHREIDELNILNATYLAMNRAIAKLKTPPALALIDGNRADGVAYPSRCVVGGDAKCASIAAASILAKVTRDRHMLDMAKKYPEFLFERHKGYGTKLHYEALRKHGPCEIHRLTFLKKMR